MKSFRVYFDRNTGIDDYAHIDAETLGEAKRKAQEYRRAWDIKEKIGPVVEVPTIRAFGRYGDGVSIAMKIGDRDMCRVFRRDESVQAVYDWIQELIKLQDEQVRELIE